MKNKWIHAGFILLIVVPLAGAQLSIRQAALVFAAMFVAMLYSAVIIMMKMMHR